jgi:hypothetical protein
MWFGPSFINLKVTFPGPNPSTWVLKEQISENDDPRTQEECEELETIPEVRGVFICSKIEGNGSQEAIMKVVMQFVYSLLYKDNQPPYLPLFVGERRNLSSNTFVFLSGFLGMGQRWSRLESDSFSVASQKA